MNILIVGGGGREHALAWKAAQSEQVTRVYVAPGNAGTALEPRVENIAIGAEDIEALLAFALERGVEFTIVGPEAPLVAGIVDHFEARGLAIFGPNKGAAQLEGSKAFTKEFLQRHHIPTAAYESFTAAAPAKSYIASHKLPLVIKADGLAAGKGVIIANNLEEANAAVDEMLAEGKFGAAGQRIVVEDFLEGEEASFIAIVGGGHILPLATSQDHKARDDGDRGPNTGGMGAYSPAPVVDEAMHARIMGEIIEPTVRAMAAEGHPYTGFLYAGIMIGRDRVPRVLEYNCRGGDPETQPIMLRMRSDLVALCRAAVDGSLGGLGAEWDARVALGVVMTAGGYPDAYDKGDVIRGLGGDGADTKVFHAGTVEADGQVLTAGGRVLCVCALGKSTQEAQSLAYQRLRTITWNNAYWRSDIGYRAVAREKQKP
jgi:phosphoribosylamine---glycine ligase